MPGGAEYCMNIFVIINRYPEGLCSYPNDQEKQSPMGIVTVYMIKYLYVEAEIKTRNHSLDVI